MTALFYPRRDKKKPNSIFNRKRFAGSVETGGQTRFPISSDGYRTFASVRGPVWLFKYNRNLCSRPGTRDRHFFFVQKPTAGRSPLLVFREKSADFDSEFRREISVARRTICALNYRSSVPLSPTHPAQTREKAAHAVNFHRIITYTHYSKIRRRRTKTYSRSF